MSIKTIRCAIYTRKSSDEGLEQEFNSLDAQFEACSSFIASQKHEGWKQLSARYDDGGVSGGTLEREGLQKLLDDIDAGKIDMVVVYKIDRLTRSLADFARLVERLEKKNCSFVSVTQAFNTSTSMGRLTLNVLLSFAQFEREVTAERIRDKIAASKKKGFWMGGLVPLGYNRNPDPQKRELVLAPDEAKLVERIFALYEEHGCLAKVEQACIEEGIRSKQHIFSTGRTIGSSVMTRGQIHYVLTNPVYRGFIRHKDAVYPSTHPAIIDEKLWKAVQDKLQQASARPRGKRSTLDSNAAGQSSSVLCGNLFDETGDHLTPSHTKRHGRQYRYYVSNRLQTDSKDRSGWRISAPMLEELVSNSVIEHLKTRISSHAILKNPDTVALQKIEVQFSGLLIIWLKDPKPEFWKLVERVTINPGELTITLSRSGLSAALETSTDLITQDALTFTTEFQTRRRGVETRIIAAEAAAMPDPTLRRTLALAHRWVRELKTGKGLSEISAEAKHAEAFIRTRAPLAFLSPKIQAAILAGTQPVELTTERLARTRIPLDWGEQEKLFGFI